VNAIEVSDAHHAGREGLVEFVEITDDAHKTNSLFLLRRSRSESNGRLEELTEPKNRAAQTRNNGRLHNSSTNPS
jgi:hypothetical protein